MKRIYSVLLLLVMLSAVKQAWACDQCSCSSGAAFNNISEFATYNYLMLRLGYGSMHGDGDVTAFSANMYMDIVGGYSLNKRIHVSGYLPLRYNYFAHEGNTHSLYGLGDAGLLANVIAWSNADDMMKRTKLTISARGGIEFPTGNFNEAFRAEDVPAAMSTGSGSIDVLGGARLIVRNDKNTITFDYLGKYNTANKVEYQFGLQQMANVFIGRTIKKPGASWLPYAGIAGEWSGGDTYHDNPMSGTSGYNLGVMAGVEYARTNWVFGAHTDMPFISNYDTEVTIHPKASLRVMRLFN